MIKLRDNSDNEIKSLFGLLTHNRFTYFKSPVFFFIKDR